jgi:hypothetical protein
MPQAPAYNRSKNFSENNPDRTDHASLNAELDRAAESINALRDNVALLQSDDGTLKNSIVSIASLSAEVLDLMTGTDVLTIEGPEGPVGASFNADYKGLESERAAFAGQPKGFSFLAMDTGLMYFKLSNTSGNWSSGYQFGRGEKGDDGAPGTPGTNGTNGTNGLITSVDTATKTVGLIGKTALNIQTQVVGGQLKLIVSTV